MILATSSAGGKSDLAQLANDLGSFALACARDGASLDQCERGVLSRILALGFSAMQMFLGTQGNGDLGPTVETQDGKTLHRSEAVQQRSLRTIFGEHSFASYVYASGSKRKIELRPIDARLNLPDGKASYLLQEFTQMFCVEKAFAVGARQFEAVFRQKLSVDVLEDINRAMGEQAEQFLDNLTVPPAAEEGAILVVTADVLQIRRKLLERGGIDTAVFLQAVARPVA